MDPEPTLAAVNKFNGTTYRSREDIVDQWAKYFTDLYTPSNLHDFDAEWEHYVKQEVDETFRGLSPDQDVTVSPALVAECIRLYRSEKHVVDIISHTNTYYMVKA
ncbi:hypothetical protein DPMN_145021 [Dreissena polymorpha]|uniref:Uncharacterized protein n=1 Tax=Dreissena polymorpha TaxID=45954 RepID=A0A9D4F5W3_DREPO|nr:hypothetical protein DPMN_145021 [Dreissena polymorpha]